MTDYITVNYLPEIVAQNPIDIALCDSGSASYGYDLSYNTSIVKSGLNPLTQVTYHATLAQAEAGTNVLPTIYNAATGTTIYVRIKNFNNPCYTIKSFQLLASPPPLAYIAPNKTKCATSTFNNAAFDLNQQNSAILSGQSSTINALTYYTSMSNANSHTNPIANNYIFATNNTPIYARVENIFDPACYSISTFTLFITPLPTVDVLQNVFVCDGYALPSLTNGNYFTEENGAGTALFAGTVVSTTSTIYIFNQPNGPTGCANGSNFTVNILDPAALTPDSGSFCGSYTLPSPTVGNFYTGHGGTGTVVPPGTMITQTQTLNYYFKSDEPPFCIIDQDFTITILPTVSLETFPTVFDCTSYTLPALTVGNYYTEANGGGIPLVAGTILFSSQTVYVYASTPDNCTAQTSFEVVIGINIPPDVSQCVPYTLPALTVGKYYTGPQGSGTQIPAGTVINLSQIVYVYVTNNNGNSCTDNLHFSISIAQPIIDVMVNVSACESYTLPDLTSGEYYTGPDVSGVNLHAGDVLFTTQTVYIFKQSTTSANCSNQSSFVVSIFTKPVIDSRSDIDICNSYVLTDLAVGNYYTGPDGTGTMLPGGTIITTSQRIYIHAVSNIPPFCTNENSFNITVFSIEADDPADVMACDNYTLPALVKGRYYKFPGGPMANQAGIMSAGDVITSSQTIYVYAESGERINCTDENSFTVTINVSPVVAPIAAVEASNSYTLPALSVGNYFTGANGTGTQLNAGDVITTDQTIYVYAQTATIPNCTDEKSFRATIYNVDELPDVTICTSYTLPTLAQGGYYTGQNGTGIHLLAGQNVTSSLKIYVYGVAPFTIFSTDESSFDVTIINAPVVYPVTPSLLVVCDEDVTNDGITAFDLTVLNTSVLGPQTGAEYIATYYPTFNDAVAGTNAMVSTDLKTVYVKVSNILAASCFDVKVIALKVNKLPEPKPVGGVICYDSTNHVLLNSYTIPSGLSADNYFFQWFDEAGQVVGNSNTYQAVLPGIYSVIATDMLTGCISAPVFVGVVSSEPALVSYTMSDPFDDNQVIHVEAAGVGGDYEYQLDFGPFQDSPVFENVSTGNHTITVRDKNGCGLSTSQALIVNYPKFFTPNGDGYNDTWNIKTLQNQSKATIMIYDRYGKIMTQIKPEGNGWDGTVGGQIMPSTDYWFTISYVEDGAQKEFRSHFAMKR